MRILYVDDEPDIREIGVLALQLDPEFEVRPCESGPDALRISAEWNPDLILLDVMMPGISGPDTLAELRRRPKTSETPVIFITARAQQDELRRLAELPCSGVIFTPFDPMTLARTARSYL